MTDPFRHHPELRGLITPPADSPWRHVTTAALLDRLKEAGIETGMFFEDDAREALRAEAMARHPGGDLWVFAYGSLMWDPGIAFDTVRHARIDGYARKFILHDNEGGRGTADAPGLMAALTEGDVCEGLAFRIPAAEIDAESRILFQREMIAPGYLPSFLPARIGGQTETVLTFTADLTQPIMRPDLTHAEQVALIATGHGILGTSYDYIAALVRQLDALDIPDPHIRALYADVEAVRAR